MKNRNAEALVKVYDYMKEPDEHPDNLQEEITKPQQEKYTRIGRTMFSEFRYIILTVLLVVTALFLQNTITGALDYILDSKFKKRPGRMIGIRFMVSVLFIVITICTTVLWKPIQPQMEDS
jgi:uncharacterized BrkB/YihY/UPF0761 family membrane protein